MARKVSLYIPAAAKDVLRTISNATEMEELPFVSRSRYPRQAEKGFVAAVRANKVRVWKVPSASRSLRQNICVPYLHGRVVDTERGCTLRGSFALHPFNHVMVALAIGFLVAAWAFPPKGLAEKVFWTALTVLFLFFLVGMVWERRRLRPKEEMDVVGFVLSLFPGAEDVSGQVGAGSKGDQQARAG